MTNTLDHQLNETPKQVALTLLDKDAKVRLVDKLQTQQMIHRGQKLLHRLVVLKNNKLFGRSDKVSDPDDNISIDSPVTNHYESGLGKMAVGAGMLALGIGIPYGAWLFASGAKDAIVKPSDPPAVSVPVEKPQPRTGVKMKNYSLRLGK